MKKIIAFSGSNSAKSINQQLIQIIANYVYDVEVEILTIRDYPTVMYGLDEEEANGFPKSIIEFQKKINEADGFIISSPEHNGSIPAAFKNIIDWLSRMERKIFNDKPVIFLSASPGGRGGASVLQHLLSIMPHQGANIIGGHGIGKFYDKVIDGHLADEEDKKKLQALIDQLIKAL